MRFMPASIRVHGWCLWLTTWVVFGACGCRHVSQVQGRSHQGTPTPRYWLRDTFLLGAKKGPIIREFGHEPVAIELLPDGSVRSLPGATDPFEGVLPEALLYLPGDYGRGLMLYAQREATLLVDRPEGAEAGVIHPGAFVSVAPGDDKMALIGLPEFQRYGEPMVAFVERSALGFQRTELAPIKRGEKGKTTIGYFTGLSCRENWTSWTTGASSQVVDGVELREYGESPRQEPGAKGYMYAWCSARAVAKRGSELRMHGANAPGDDSVPISSVPAGYQAVTVTDPNPLERVIWERGTVSWLVEREISKDRVSLRCEEWTFELFEPSDLPSAAQLEGRLVGPVPLTGDERAGIVPYYPFTYDRANALNPAHLHLDALVPNLWRCICDFDYFLLGAIGDELHMMPLRIPEGIVAYDPSETEWWYLSRSACEAKRRDLTARLEIDPSESARVGFRLPPQPYEP